MDRELSYLHGESKQIFDYSTVQLYHYRTRYGCGTVESSAEWSLERLPRESRVYKPRHGRQCLESMSELGSISLGKLAVRPGEHGERNVSAGVRLT